MDKEAVDAINNLTSQLKSDKPRKTNIWVDYAMRFGTTVSAAGVIALFGLFVNKIPALENSIAHVAREQEYFIRTVSDVQEFTKKPRFTKEDFISEMRLYDQRLDLIDLELKKRTGYFNNIDEDIATQDRRINKLENFRDKIEERDSK